jgi:hypothetical protein
MRPTCMQSNLGEGVGEIYMRGFMISTVGHSVLGWWDKEVKMGGHVERAD